MRTVDVNKAQFERISRVLSHDLHWENETYKLERSFVGAPNIWLDFSVDFLHKLNCTFSHQEKRNGLSRIIWSEDLDASVFAKSRIVDAYVKREYRRQNLILSCVARHLLILATKIKQPLRHKRFEIVKINHWNPPPWVVLSSRNLSPSYLNPLFQSEVKCEALDMKIIFYSHANIIHYHKKDFELSLLLKVIVSETQKWPTVDKWYKHFQKFW